VYQNYSKDDLYIGTDIGVFHKDSTMTEWQFYNQDLPFVSVRELEIQYSAGKLRAATFGRGVWESDLNSFPSSVSQVNPDFIRVFPNPVNSEFYVKTPYVLDNYKLKLYSITGKLLLEQSLKSDFTKVEISDLSKGIYIYKIEGGGEIVKTDKLFIL
jgi:hypothetical protein